MKNKLVLLTITTVLLWSCSNDFLNEKNETDLSVDFIYDTPEGIGFAVTALYPIQRYMGDYGDINHSLPTLGLLTGDDITFTRAGETYGKERHGTIPRLLLLQIGMWRVFGITIIKL
jgi:hypothetical protein